MTPGPRPVAVAGLLLLAGCQGRASLQSGASGALDADQVRLAVSQVSLLDDGGGVVTLDSDDPGVHDWLTLEDGGTLTLVSNAQLPQAHYVGVALDFDAAQAELDRGGQTYPIDVPTEPVYATIDVTVGANDKVSLFAGLDLRLSLSDQTASNGTWVLQPRLNAVNLDGAAALSGGIAATVEQSQACLQGRSSPDGAAVYAYPQAGLTPYDDSAAASPHPTATAKVTWNADDTGAYSFPHLSPGSYTIALTCLASQDDPNTADGLPFASRADVTLASGEAVTLDLD